MRPPGLVLTPDIGDNLRGLRPIRRRTVSGSACLAGEDGTPGLRRSQGSITSVSTPRLLRSRVSTPFGLRGAGSSPGFAALVEQRLRVLASAAGDSFSAEHAGELLDALVLIFEALDSSHRAPIDDLLAHAMFAPTLDHERARTQLQPNVPLSFGHKFVAKPE